MEVVVCKTKEEASALAAAMITDAVKKNPKLVLGLATGSTPVLMYNEMAKAVLQRVDQRHFHPSEHRLRMGIKGQTHSLATQLICPLPCQLQQRSMAPVDAVKKTKRNDAVVVQVTSPQKSFLPYGVSPALLRPP